MLPTGGQDILSIFDGLQICEIDDVMPIVSYSNMEKYRKSIPKEYTFCGKTLTEATGLLRIGKNLDGCESGTTKIER